MYPQKRRSAYRQQFKKFVISCEGSVTEREYFSHLQNLCWHGVILDILTNRNESSPAQVLDRIRQYGKSLSPTDEMWCVVDKDQWTDAQLDALVSWQQESSNIVRGVALSNPKFELWLLSHFQQLPTSCGSSECDRLLEGLLPEYKKHIDRQMFPVDAIRQAIEYSAATCLPGTIPRATVGTNVGELVKRILAASQMGLKDGRIMGCGTSYINTEEYLNRITIEQIERS